MGHKKSQFFLTGMPQKIHQEIQNFPTNFILGAAGAVCRRRHMALGLSAGHRLMGLAPSLRLAVSAGRETCAHAGNPDAGRERGHWCHGLVTLARLTFTAGTMCLRAGILRQRPDTKCLQCLRAKLASSASGQDYRRYKVRSWALIYRADADFFTQ